MNYLDMLQNGYNQFKGINSYEDGDENTISKLEYLSSYIFNFTTYDSEMAELFATKALEVATSINGGFTFEYIDESEENYKWYLIMCNMDFFGYRLEWGSSVRGAWWRDSAYETCGLFDGDNQITEFKFSKKEWEKFIDAIIEFAKD